MAKSSMKSFTSSISKSFSKNSSSLLKNKTVLYLVTFIALMNILGYLLVNNYQVVVMFLAVGILVYQLNKNMIVVLLSCLLTANLFALVVKKQQEGFKPKNSADTKKAANKDAKEAFNSTKTTKSSKKKKSGFQNQGKNVIAKTAAPVSDDAEEVKSRIDYGTTIERAYDNLDNILGGDNMQKLTADTTRLIEKQNKLVKNMQGMAPMITQYKDLLKNMNLDNIQNLAKKLTGSPLSLDPGSKST